MTTERALMLDPDIRDWVVLPLFVIMVAAFFLRHTVGVLLQSPKTPASAMAARVMTRLQHTTRIRAGGAVHYMPASAAYLRQQHYAALLQEEATWCLETEKHEKEQAANGGSDGAGKLENTDPMADMMMNNPMGMLKGNMAFMVQNMVMMQGIQYFFSGFILLQVPFPLTAGFKNMFQRGVVELPDLPSSYVSSISWYFLVMYGLRGLFKLVMGEPTIEWREQERYQQQQLGLQVAPSNPGAGKQDAESLVKLLQQEAENLELLAAGAQQHHFKSEFDSVEKRLLGKSRYPKKTTRSTIGDDPADFLLGGGSKKATGRTNNSNNNNTKLSKSKKKSQ